MAKIYYNYDKLKTDVMPNIDNAISNLKNAKTICLSLSSPSSFRFSGFNINLKSNLETYIKDLIAIENDILDRKNALEKIDNTMENMLNNIKQYDIQARQPAVRNIVIK